MSIARFIDHTILKPTTTLADVQTICEEAQQWNFASVCIPPYFVKDASGILMNGPVKVCTVIGFPFGYSHYSAKTAEAVQALEDGAIELDMVMNGAAFRGNDLAYLETEIGEICRLTADSGAVLKVIIESGLLSEEEIVRCCELYRHYPVQFLKTSTGYAEKGASVEAVRTMRAHLPEEINVKASGGIRDYTFARALLDAGASRLGCSASVAIASEGGSGVAGEGY